MPQVQSHHPYAVCANQTAQLDQFMAHLRKEIEDLIAKTPNLGSSWYDTFGRVTKESKDVAEAICEGKPWSSHKELKELSVVSTALAFVNQNNPVLTIS